MPWHSEDYSAFSSVHHFWQPGSRNRKPRKARQPDKQISGIPGNPGDTAAIFALHLSSFWGHSDDAKCRLKSRINGLLGSKDKSQNYAHTQEAWRLNPAKDIFAYTEHQPIQHSTPWWRHYICSSLGDTSHWTLLAASSKNSVVLYRSDAASTICSHLQTATFKCKLPPNLITALYMWCRS